jgi:hypothetical protein
MTPSNAPSIGNLTVSGSSEVDSIERDDQAEPESSSSAVIVIVLFPLFAILAAGVFAFASRRKRNAASVEDTSFKDGEKHYIDEELGVARANLEDDDQVPGMLESHVGFAATVEREFLREQVECNEKDTDAEDIGAASAIDKSKDIPSHLEGVTGETSTEVSDTKESGAVLEQRILEVVDESQVEVEVHTIEPPQPEGEASESNVDESPVEEEVHRIEPQQTLATISGLSTGEGQTHQMEGEDSDTITDSNEPEASESGSDFESQHSADALGVVSAPIPLRKNDELTAADFSSPQDKNSVKAVCIPQHNEESSLIRSGGDSSCDIQLKVDGDESMTERVFDEVLLLEVNELDVNVPDSEDSQTRTEDIMKPIESHVADVWIQSTHNEAESEPIATTCKPDSKAVASEEPNIPLEGFEDTNAFVESSYPHRDVPSEADVDKSIEPIVYTKDQKQSDPVEELRCENERDITVEAAANLSLNYVKDGAGETEYSSLRSRIESLVLCVAPNEMGKSLVAFVSWQRLFCRVILIICYPSTGADNIDEIMMKFEGKDSELISALETMNDCLLLSQGETAFDTETTASISSSPSNLRLAIEKGQWHVIGQAAAILGKEFTANKASDGSSQALYLNKEDRIQHLSDLIVNGDWSGIVVSAGQYQAMSKDLDTDIEEHISHVEVTGDDGVETEPNVSQVEFDQRHHYSFLKQAIEKGDWHAVGRAAAIMGRESAAIASADSANSSAASSGTFSSHSTLYLDKQDRIHHLDQLIAQGDWIGIVILAGQYQAMDEDIV